jgi:hypothetical protein
VTEKHRTIGIPVAAGDDEPRQSSVGGDTAVGDGFQTPPVDTSYAATLQPSRLRGFRLTAMVSTLSSSPCWSSTNAPPGDLCGWYRGELARSDVSVCSDGQRSSRSSDTTKVSWGVS